MNKKTGIAVIIISIIALCLSAVSFARTMGTEEQKTGDIQYVMYLGTNDKDTNEPVCGPEEAKELAKGILIDHFGGFTIQEANGGWKDGDTIYQEYTLVIYLSDTSLDDVHKAAADLIKAFNQSSVLIQANETTTEFFSSAS